jgi:hypothetical protein
MKKSVCCQTGSMCVHCTVRTAVLVPGYQQCWTLNFSIKVTGCYGIQTTIVGYYSKLRSRLCRSGLLFVRAAERVVRAVVSTICQ